MADTTARGPVTGVNVGQLREQVRGRVITADDEGYNEARAVHNGMFDKRPLAVLRAEQVADVIAGVNFARDNGLDLSIRDGGHSAPGFGTNDDGLVIDMTPMHTVRVDPGSKTAHAGAGATWGDFNHATHAFGLATTGGIISTTGITGLTLGGEGRAWTADSARHGPAEPASAQRYVARAGTGSVRHKRPATSRSRATAPGPRLMAWPAGLPDRRDWDW